MPQHNIAVIILSAVISLACYDKAQRNRYTTVFSTAMNEISTRYIDVVPRRKLFDAAMTGMVDALDDQYSSYISPEDYRQFQVDIDQEFGGVGIEVMLDKDTKQLTVISPLVGTPAYLAGVRTGDVITHVNGKSIEGLKLNDTVKVLRGPIGKSVRMTVLHRGSDVPEVLEIVRARIQVDSVKGDIRQPDGEWNFFVEEDTRIGYLRVLQFGEQTVNELKKAFSGARANAPLKINGHQVEALIVDLRGNPGGLLESAVLVCRMFIDDGVIVTTRNGKGESLGGYAANGTSIVPPKSKLPVVVLVDNGSASASEIVSACLQDHQRATIVGQRTWGKGTVQNIITLESGSDSSALKLTTATYWRPSEKNIHRGKNAKEEDDWGVLPDEGMSVKLTPEQELSMLKYRRRRDIIRTNGQGAELVENDDADSDEPFDDPQLRRAIEHLQELLPPIAKQSEAN